MTEATSLEPQHHRNMQFRETVRRPISSLMSSLHSVHILKFKLLIFSRPFVYAGYHINLLPHFEKTGPEDSDYIRARSILYSLAGCSPGHALSLSFPYAQSLHANFITPAYPNAPISSRQPAYSSPQSLLPEKLHLISHRPITHIRISSLHHNLTHVH